MPSIIQIRRTLWGGCLISCSIFISCSGDQIDIPDTPLQGKVAGEDWEFKFGGFGQYSTTEFQYRLYSTKEPGTDPCAFVSTSNPYLSVVVPSNGSSLSLPFLDPLKNFQFVLGNGSAKFATSGFIEIYGYDNFRLYGYIQAIFDEDNSVEGRFELDPC